VKPIRAAIVYHFLAHYREPIFRLLCSDNDRPVKYHVFASDRADDPSLPSVKALRHDPTTTAPELVARWTVVHNVWLSNKVLWQPAVVRMALSRRFDCIVLLGNANYLSSWLAAILARLTAKRVLMWTHGFLRREPPLKSALRLAFYRLAHGLLLYGNRARTILGEQGFDPASLYVVYNSLDHDRQIELRKTLTDATRSATRSELGVPATHKLLLSVGRQNRAKRYEELIEAVARAIAAGSRLRLVLVGDGPERGALEALVARLSLQESVRFEGPCYDETRLAAMISAADLFVVPGDIGLSCMHAFAYGLPVITHDNLDHQNPEIEAIRPGQNGDLFREHDVEDLARVIGIWLERLHDPAERERAAQQCTEVIDRFYNARYQREAIDRAVQELPPMTETPGGVTESPRAARSAAAGNLRA
jgi:glycosyltransferase involved in cell wall biosynthesis